jgi:hypothetical protein
LQTNRLITGPTASILIRNAPNLQEALVNLTALLDATNMNVSLNFEARNSRTVIEIKPRLPLGAMLNFSVGLGLVHDRVERCGAAEASY